MSKPTLYRAESGELRVAFGRGEVFVSAGYLEGKPILVLSVGRGSAEVNTQPFAGQMDDYARVDLDDRDIVLVFENEAGLDALEAEVLNVRGYFGTIPPSPDEVEPHPISLHPREASP